jgi:hypothetical protein
MPSHFELKFWKAIYFNKHSGRSRANRVGGSGYLLHNISLTCALCLISEYTNFVPEPSGKGSISSCCEREFWSEVHRSYGGGSTTSGSEDKGGGVLWGMG